MKIVKPYPNLYRDIDRQGRLRWRLRVPGHKAKTIKGTYGTPEFAAAYHAAMTGSEAIEKKGLGVAKHGTVTALARSYLRSAEFAAPSATTQRARRYLVEQFAAEHGTKDVAKLEHRHVKAIVDAMRATPGQARNVLTMLRVLMALAIEDGIRADDPSRGIKRPKLRGDGWHPWSEQEISTYEAKHPIGSQARLAMALALYTAQRRSDVARMGRQHLRDGVLSVRQQKTGTALAIPFIPPCRRSSMPRRRST
jgi:integrase